MSGQPDRALNAINSSASITTAAGAVTGKLRLLDGVVSDFVSSLFFFRDNIATTYFCTTAS